MARHSGGGRGQEGDGDEPRGRGGAGGNWRDNFLNRHGRDGSRDRGAEGNDSDAREPRARSLSKPRASSRPPRGADTDVSAADAFNQTAVLEQDRALMQQLTQRPQGRERPPVKKPPPPPKIKPYRSRTGSPLAAAGADMMADRSERGVGGIDSGISLAQDVPSASVSLGAELAPSGLAVEPVEAPSASMPPIVEVAAAAAPETALRSPTVASKPLLPVVPASGDLFTASDINKIMDQLGGAPVEGKAKPAAAPKAAAPVKFDAYGPGSRDISNDFWTNQGGAVPSVQPTTNVQPAASLASGPSATETTARTFQAPQRKALQEQINAIDSWLDEDFTGGPVKDRGAAANLNRSEIHTGNGTLPSAPSSAVPEAEGEVQIFLALEDAKRKKALGQCPSQVALKSLAVKMKPILPGLSLEKLVVALRLFSSARYEDHDLYLRILGEIPVQIRGISPEMLTSCVRVLWRIRLREETYQELFSMEAMNMIRAKRRPTPRAPRRPPAPRAAKVDGAASSEPTPVATPVPPSMPPSADGPAPFSGTQLIHLGNALSRLGAKFPTRFMDVFQEQLAVSIPMWSAEDCELVCPTLGMSQLMHDPLRRAFLERCAQVDAGRPIPTDACNGNSAPEIAVYQKEEARRRRRLKHYRNIYVVEASVRKETFSFFSSLTQEVRAYLDQLHADSTQLTHQDASAFAQQVAAVLDQLGTNCDLTRMSGPLGLDIVVKGINPHAEKGEVVYECNDASCYYVAHHDNKGAQRELTALTKFRHKLLQRLGVTLVHINMWEWSSMSEAQRVNYIVKVQSLQ